MEKEPKGVAQNATAENEVVANTKTPPVLFGGDTTGETEGLSELALAGGETTNGQTTATGTPPPAGAREEDELARVQLTSSKDNAFHASRWENTDGTTTKYAETFKEKIKIELKREFGKDVTHAEVLKMIEDAKKAKDLTKAEDYRKKLFRANQYAIVETLNVDKTTDDGKVHGQNALGQDFSTTQNHEMYGRIKGSTYCNIYAYDVVTAMGAYVPRCWWTSKFEKEALEAMEAKKPYTTVPKYGTNVSEMNANALNSWFDRIGKYFGWRKAASMEEGQNAANNGNVVVLQAANKEASKSGHIAVILAERDDHKASRVKDKVDVPLTSQAGSVNHKYKTGSKWWEDANHKNGAAWIHDGAMDSPLLKPEEIGVEGAPAATTETPTGGVKGGENTPKPEVKPAVQPVNNTQTKDNKPAAQTGANPNGTLTLKKFELTVQGEGADGATKYIEWPNTSASGVTLGKGYDIGSRSAKQVIEELTASGMSKVQAEKISKGVGLKGQAAGDWVKANKKDVGEIALDVQYKLLDLVMPKFTAQAKDVATNTKAQKDSGGNYTNAAGREKGDGVKAGTYVMSAAQWDGLHPAMVEFITDLKYQGGYYLYDRIEKINSALIKHHGNHLEQFKAVAALFESAKAGELSYMDNYGKGIGEGTGNKELFYGMTKEQLANASTRRNRIRLAFLKHIIAALEAGKTVSYGPIEKVDPTPATKPVTQPATGNTTGGTPTQPVAEVPVKETPAKETATGGEGANKDDKNITISRGVLQMTSEGSFEGNAYDVRTPHFPENLAIYTPIAAGETIAAKDRFDVTGDRAKKAASGAYKRKTLLNRHEVADYDTKVSGADKIATGPNNSGVTIGFGYDIGAAWNTTDKEKCKKDLKAAGISEENADALSAAVGLRTMAAGRKTAELRKTVKITADQAVNLLGVVMGRYDANYTKGVVHPAIEEAFSYVNYWKGNGGGKAFVSKMFEAAKDKKGVDQFTAVISVIDSEGWGGGFDVIKNFLKVIKGKIQDGNDVSFVTKTTLDGLLNGDNDTFDIVKESAKGTYIGKKDYHEQLTGKPKANTGSSTTSTGTKEATKPATPAAESAPSIIKDTVGSGGKNNAADVRIVKQCLYNSGLDLAVNDVADKQLTDAIIAFQKAHFSWTPDGLITPGKATVKKLAEFKDKARPAAQPAAKPAAVAQETPTQRMEKEYKKYSDGQIDMVGLAKAMKTYAVSSPATVIALIGGLGYTETDNFAYAFASHSTDAELSSYDRGLLKRLSDDLDAYLTMSRTANLGQKARIDKAISKPLVVPAAKPATGGESAGTKAAEKPAVKPVAKPVASEQQAQSASTATGSTRTPVTISKSVGVGGKNEADDLKKIQDLLKDIGFRLGSGKLQKNTNGAIAAFQVANGLGSDGRVDPGGKTLETLNNTPSGAFKNTAKQLAEDSNAPNLTHSKWTNRAHFATDTAGEIIPRQFYGNMNTLIKYMEIIADNLKGTFNVNCGYRSPHHNANTEGSAERSNHQFGRAVDIKPSDYTPKQFAAELRRLIKEGKIHAGGIGTYGTFVHYDIDSSREWNG